MYFQQFPLTYFTLDDQETVQVVRNIFLRAIISEEIKKNYSIYDEYDIKDGETPQILAHKFYGTTELYWVILHMNDIIDPRFDWLLSYSDLVAYCEANYENIYATHHYVDSDGHTVNSTEPGAISVSNFQYEESLNEQKRRIKILKAQYVDTVVTAFQNKINAQLGT